MGEGMFGSVSPVSVVSALIGYAYSRYATAAAVPDHIVKTVAEVGAELKGEIELRIVGDAIRAAFGPDWAAIHGSPGTWSDRNS